ncbi:MAG: hypothetical protein RJA44_11 [Pseudomonadota bacterium]
MKSGWVRPIAAGLLALLAGCNALRPGAGTTDGGSEAATEAQPAAPRGAASAASVPGGRVLARNERLLLYRSRGDESHADLAAHFLGDPAQAWQIVELNQAERPMAGETLLVPLQPWNPVGISAQGLRQITILCYHRFAPAGARATSKMMVPASNFAAQLEWLARNDYRVLKLADLEAVLDGRQPVPPRAVVITIDDGYESVHRHAFPLLKQYGVPATVFLYSDFVGAADALSWAQMQEMRDSGLVEIQAHSKSHANLSQRLEGESDERYRQRLDLELSTVRTLIERRLPGQQVRHFAFPFGDANVRVIEALTRQQYALGLSVQAGGTAFHAQPLYLRRTMIYGDHDLDAFRTRLQPLMPLPAAAPASAPSPRPSRSSEGKTR